ncbi:Fibronectin type III domain containing protein, putative [Trypanosoma equiperdum]|uniref:Fibronectin type III domain containing protein, putative n=1 Tax=Trypanosoma equiperdum TaxID=5694 RepID=A0A1G4I6D0_TRYEQ|nr:Fibronectin type III domain containing protein, putative [Trypanosoma equiperdum]
MEANTDILCNAVVNRMGEMFGEFGFQFDSKHSWNDVTDVTKWQLQVDEETAGEDTVETLYDIVLPIKQRHKVVKLRASSFYRARVRVYSEKTMSWSVWSEVTRTATLAAVTGQINDVGEDYVRVLWDRPARAPTGIAAEIDADATRSIADIDDFELRVLRESDMRQEFCDRFETGVRTHIVRGLRPGTAYIVMIRYKTLINTMKKWVEVGRFLTRQTNVMSLLSCGEDVVTVSWALASTSDDTIGYVVPDNDVHRYEVLVQSDCQTFRSVEFPQQERTYRLDKLTPGGSYIFTVRSLSVQGYWGRCSEPLCVRTASRPELSVVASGESFLSFTWARMIDAETETQVEYRLSSLNSVYKQEERLDVGPLADDKVIHIEGLTSGTEYNVSIRTFLNNEWGMWTEPKKFRTEARASLTFLERGEDFITMKLEGECNGRFASRFNIVIMQVESHDELNVVKDEEIVSDGDTCMFTVEKLRPNTMYILKCRSYQFNRLTGYEGWGEFTDPKHTQTLQPLGVRLWDIGEDFAQVVWRRGLSDVPLPMGSSDMGISELWADLKYELCVDCVDSGETEVLREEMLGTSFKISNLQPATTYIVSVRACNEVEQWGAWSRVKLRTLAPMMMHVDEIGEDFVRLMWERQLVDDVLVGGDGINTKGDDRDNTVAVAAADMFVSSYAVFVFSRELSGSSASSLSGYHMGGNSEVARYKVVSSEHTSLRVEDLLPDREYMAVVRACTSTRMWGLWSQPLRFRSNAQFRIPVNNLIIGENYVSIVWSRDANPLKNKDVHTGDLTVTKQELRIQSIDQSYSKDHSLPADMRELKIYGLHHATAYNIQIRAAGPSGDWGLWTPPVQILTRDTILTRAVEVADDYAIIAWERRRPPNQKNYATGRGVVTSYHLRVFNVGGVVFEVFLGDGDSPYRISNLKPDTYYCVEIKANYNDEEWGSWSSPLWCLTMKSLEIQTRVISEEFCEINVHRPHQQKRLPEDDGNRSSDDRVVVFGQCRPCLMLCVTSPVENLLPHSSTGQLKPRVHNSSLPVNAADHRLIYQTEFCSTTEDTEHTIPSLRANTVYCVSVRSKLTNGEWGMWSQPPLFFATVPPTEVEFTDIGEDFVSVGWKRNKHNIPPHVSGSSEVKLEQGTIVASRVKIREIDGSFQKLIEVSNSLTALHINELQPSTTYGIVVQTCGENSVWGVWSTEAKVRTIPGMDISIHHVSEDAVWVSWSRMSDTSNLVSFDTALNTDATAKGYEVCIAGDGYFKFTKEVQDNKLFFRGLLPDTVYKFGVRSRGSDKQDWGIWATRSFHTKPRLRVTFGNVGEHFAIVEWRRHLPTCLDRCDTEAVFESEDVVQQFRLRVERVGDPVHYVYDLSPYVSSFRLKDLQPSAEYCVWLCAKGYEGIWGFWNEEARVRTLPKLQLDITAIGEDYVTVSWFRPNWAGDRNWENEGETNAVDRAVSGYKVHVLDKEGNEVVSQYVNFRQTTCTLSSLKLSTIYSVEVSAKDTYDELGLWSDSRRFVTLESVEANVLLVGETFCQLEWGRRSDLAERRSDLVDRRSGRRTSGFTDGEGSSDTGSYSAASEAALAAEGDVGGSDVEQIKRRASSCVSIISRGARHVYGCTASSELASGEGGDGDDDYIFDETVMRGCPDILQWHVQMECRRLSGGLPGADDIVEFYAPAAEMGRLVTNLQADAEYTLTVRAQDKNNTWGHWSKPRILVTCPLLKLSTDSITETFINVSWTRPPMTRAVSHCFCCYPEEADIHNYQVHIEPLAAEEPFDERDEPLVNGARLYETSQRSLRLCNLTPGAHYRVVVCEQRIDFRGKFVPDSWGTFSQTAVVEMVHPMGVVPIEIGEDYCLVGWRRVPRKLDTTPETGIIRGVVKVTAYELRATRLDAKAKKKYEGPLSLDTVLSLEPTATSYHLGNLVSNTIYAVSMRAKAEGYWGPWSEVTKFVSQGRLKVKVHSVYEDVILVSWSRPLPDWACARPDLNKPDDLGDLPQLCGMFTETDILSGLDAGSDAEPEPASVLPSDNGVEGKLQVEDGEDDGNDWDAVQIGDYSIERYELYLEGITCDVQQCLTLSKYQMSVRITGLQPDQIYSVCVRSLSEKRHWSMLSHRESVLTLTSMVTEVSHHTETMAIIRWFRIPQDVRKYEAFLEERRTAEERRCDERERHELFDMKRRLQELEESEERNNLKDHLELRHEHNAAVRNDAIHHLRVENIVLGDPEVTGYHLRFYGEGVMPTIQGVHHLLLHSPSQKMVGRKRRAESMRLLTKMKRQQRKLMSGATSACHMECAHVDMSAPGGAQLATSSDGGEPSTPAVANMDLGLPREDSVLFDVQLRPEVLSITVKGLTPDSPFEMEVRTRNAVGDWCPWSERNRFVTLRPIELLHERFGEHFISLYWHRLPPAVSAKIEADERQLFELNKEFSSMCPKDIKAKEQELSSEEQQELYTRIATFRDLKESVKAKRNWLASGRGEVVVHEHTPIRGYQLRIIHQNGTFEDHYIQGKSNGDTNEPIICAFTVKQLVWNTMYTALLCCDYGVGWGPWTPPLKFMTQSLIQLSITCISETFVDIEWHRAPNKRLPPIDEANTLRSDASSHEGCVCQLRITWESENEDDEGKICEEYRTMRSCCVFRVDKLQVDTKYTFEVREWGAEEAWGLWCAPKTCVTMPGMSATVEKLGEDWAQITWRRRDRRVDYDNDMNVLQHGVDNEMFYVRVLELQDNGVDGESCEEPAVSEEELAPKTLADEIVGVLTTTQQTQGPLPPQEHPVEYESDGSGRLHLTRRFNKDTFSFRVENLKQDRFYSVQVMSVTTGGQLGAWSAEQHFLTMSKIRVNVKHIDEQYAEIEWKRVPPRQHPRMDMAEVFTGSYVASAYMIDVLGRDGLQLNVVLTGATNTYYRLKSLNLDTVYTVRVLSIDECEASSMWSEPLRFVTLKRLEVYPTQITEHSVMLEWGREEQQPKGDEGTEYEGRFDPTICVGCRDCSGYLLRIYRCDEASRKLLCEKRFAGDLQEYRLDSLTPNRPYTFKICASNNLGEWGFWSEERCVYTMKLISAEVLAIGEDYVRLHWRRKEPDELQVMVRTSTDTNGTLSDEGEETSNGGSSGRDSDDNTPITVGESSRSVGGQTGDFSESSGFAAESQTTLEREDGRRSSFRAMSPDKLKPGLCQKRYPLLDQPEVRSAMYNSAKTRVAYYAITFVQEGEDEGVTFNVPGEKTTFTVSSLKPDKRYSLAVRACYGSGEFGLSSTHVTCGTLNLLSVELIGLGEDYLTASWQRLPNSFATSDLQPSDVEELICYELAVHDFTDVSYGEEDAEELPPRLRRTMIIPSNVRNSTVKELLSHHRYRVSVRRWYKPHEEFVVDTIHPELPQAEDEGIVEALNQSRAEPGAWSDGLYDVTLRDMVCFMDDGAEDFFAVHWERDPRAQPLPVRNPFPPKPVDSYQLRVYEVGPNAAANEGSLLIDKPLSGSETTYVARNLRHDSLYRIHVRCCVDNVWGRWSRIVHVMTLPKFAVEMSSIGENYAEFSWQRPRRSLLLPDGSEALCGNDDFLSTFQVDVIGLEHSYHISKQFKGARNSYRAKLLEAATVYSVSVRSLDSRRESWSPWSDRTFFATLKPMQLIVSSPGEQFATVEWFRDEQTVQEYADIVGCCGETPASADEPESLPSTTNNAVAAVPVVLGTPEVIAYHLCVFASQHSPALAIVDKQFPKDVNRYRICSLEADAAYVVVVRSCNTDSRWGLWSKEGLFRTQRVLRLDVVNVGEIYVRMKWDRGEGDRSEEKCNSQPRLDPCEYQLVLKGGNETVEHVINPSDCGVTDDEFLLPTYLLEGLSPGLDYLMALQPRYDELSWGQWTPTVGFKTLCPICVALNGVTCDSAEFTLNRMEPPPPPEASPDATGSAAGRTSTGKGRTGSRGRKGTRSPKGSKGSGGSKRGKSGKGAAAKQSPSPVSERSLLPRLVSPPDAQSSGSPTGIASPPAHGDPLLGGARIVDGEVGEEGSMERKAVVQIVKKYQVEVRKTDEIPSKDKDDDGDEVNATAVNNDAAATVYTVSAGEAAEALPRAAAPLEVEPADTQLPAASGAAAAVEGEVDGANAVDVGAACTVGAGPTEEGGDDLLPDWRRIVLCASQAKPYFRQLEFDVEGEEGPMKNITIDGLTGCTSYTVKVRAMDEHNSWGAWVEVNLTTAPFPPQSVTLRRQNAQTGLLQWEAPDCYHAYRYVVEQSHSPTDSRGKPKGSVEWRVIDIVEETNCRVRFTGPAAKVRCRVKCSLVDEGSPFSEYCEPVGVTSGTAPEPVTDLTVVGTTDNSVTLMWTPSRSETSSNRSGNRVINYRVYIGVRNCTPILASTVSDSTFTLEGLEPSTSYTIQVVTECKDGISYNNPIVNATTRSEKDVAITLPQIVDPSQEFAAGEHSPTAKVITLPEISSAHHVMIPQPPSKGKRGKGDMRDAMRHAASSSGSSPAPGGVKVPSLPINAPLSGRAAAGRAQKTARVGLSRR